MGLLSTAVGPKSGTDGARRFSLSAPTIRIWNAGSTSITRLIRFDAARNGYHFDALDWEDSFAAGPTETEAGTTYEHLGGVRLHAVLSFRISHPSYSFTSRQYPPIDGFTELDLAALDNARIANVPIEFYPHGNGLSARQDGYTVLVRKSGSGRGETMTEHRLTLEFVGKYVTATRPEEL